MHYINVNILELRKEISDGLVPDNANYYALKKIDETPNKIAIKYPVFRDNQLDYEVLTFKEFKELSLRWSHGLAKHDIKTNDRVILLIPVSIELYSLIFACFYLGITPIFIDISMPRKKIKSAMKDSKAKAVISVDALLKYKWLIKELWSKQCFSLDSKRFFLKKIDSLKSETPLAREYSKLDPQTSALITFTSGSTSRPKGANRTIEVLLNQKIISEYMWPHTENEIDMPAFPMIVLQNLGCGITSVLPALDFRDFEKMSPGLIISQMKSQNITRFSSQPYFIEKLCDYIIENNTELTSVKSIVVGGACVSKKLCLKIKKAFPHSQTNLVYGSTEAEPIAYTSIDSVLSKQGRGLLLGNIVTTLKVRILKIDAHVDINNDIIESPNTIGEIILNGPHVVKEYIDNHPANEELKPRSANGDIWHRTGDMGYFDQEGQLWLVGRISDRILKKSELIPCYDLEATLEENKDIKRAVFIKDPKVLFIESNQNLDLKQIKVFLDKVDLPEYSIKILDNIPTDRRHFSRPDRAKLRELSNA